MYLPKVLIIITLLLPITRNNQSMVHGISGKIWLSRRHNKPSKTNFVSVKVPFSRQIEGNASTESNDVNLTCANHQNHNIRFPHFSNAAESLDCLRSFNYQIAIVGVVFILSKKYWRSGYLQMDKRKDI